MKTKELLDLLKIHQDKTLLFEYEPKHFVKSNYHITEIKNVCVDAVDCGGRSDSWNETIVQLWENPYEAESKKPMSVYKALAILSKVNTIKQLDQNAELKFEYSNSNFHTAQLFVDGFEIQENQLIMKLSTSKTECKAAELCGVPQENIVEEKEACCQTTGCC